MKAIAIVIVAGCLAALAGCSTSSGLMTADQATMSQPPAAVHATPAPAMRTGQRARSPSYWEYQDSDENDATGEWYGIIGPPFGWQDN